MPIQTATLPCLAIPSLHFLVYEIFKVLLSDLGLLELELVRDDVLLRLFVERDEQLEVLVYFRIFVEFHSAHVVSVRHVFEYTSHLVRTVLALDVLRVAIDVPPDFAHKRVASTLQHQADRKIWIVLLLLEACFDKASFARHCTFLLKSQLLAHDLQAADLTDQELLLILEIVLQVLVLLDHALEGNRYLPASFHKLLPQKLVLNPCILKSLQHRILLVNPLYLPILHLVKHVCTVLVIACERLILQLIIFQVNDLLEMEDVVDALQDVAHQLLLVLDLHGSVRHQQWVRYCHVDALNLRRVVVVVLIIIGAANVEGRLFVW